MLDHDIRAGGLAERTLGDRAHVDDSLIVIIGTGVAGLITSGGRSIRGATGVAGEIGHLPVYPEGERCPCGQRSCLERYASAAAISRHYRDRRAVELTSRQIVGRLGNDPDAEQVWQEAATALGLALVSCTMTLDPGVIVLAGGLSEAGDTLLRPVRQELAARVTWREAPELSISRLGGHAGLLGAAVLAWQQLGKTEFSSWRMGARP